MNWNTLDGILTAWCLHDGTVHLEFDSNRTYTVDATTRSPEHVETLRKESPNKEMSISHFNKSQDSKNNDH